MKKPWKVLVMVACIITWLHPTEKLTVLHINDTHGQIEVFQAKDGRHYGGFARVAFLMDSLRTEAEDKDRACYFLHAGDALQGPPLSNIHKGKLDFELLDQMELDAMVAGNHEFDFGQENLAGLTEMTRFPLISANVTDMQGLLFEAFVESRIGEENILMAGLTTPSTSTGTHPDNVAGLRFLSPDSAVVSLIDSLGYCDEGLVIALTHLGWQADSALAEHVAEIDLIVGGHSHSVLEEPRKVNNALILQAGARTAYLGKLEAEISDGRIEDYAYELILLSEDVLEDSRMAASIAQAGKKVDKELDVPIGRTKVALVPGFSDEEGELSLGNLLARLMKEETGADFAFTNAGGVRAAILPGDVSLKDILTALPFNNTIVTVELTAQQVQKVLDRNISHGSASGGTLHLAGVTYEVKDSSAVNVKIDGESLDRAKTYRIATNNFLAAGGDGYKMLLDGGSLYDTGTGLAPMLTAYIERVGVVTKEKFQRDGQ